MFLPRRLFNIKPTIDTRKPSHFTPHARRSHRRPVSAGLAQTRRSLRRSKNFFSEDQLVKNRNTGQYTSSDNDDIEQLFRWNPQSE